MARTYFPILLLLGFAAFNAVLIIGASALLTRPRLNPDKATPYESGLLPYGDTRQRFSIKFYLIAILFIVFDLETVFMIPWAVHFRELSCAAPVVGGVCPAGQSSFLGLGEMLIFMTVLTVAYVYVWRKGALRWD